MIVPRDYNIVVWDFKPRKKVEAVEWMIQIGRFTKKKQKILRVS